MTISGTIEQAPTDGYYFTDVKGGDIIFRSFGSNSFSFGSGSNTLSCFRVNSNTVTMWANNIGFGTSNPQALFHMYNATSSPSFLLDGGGVSGRGSIRMINSSTGNYIQSGAQFSNDSKADIVFTSMMGTTEWMRIKASTGNVGIGTISPQYGLHVPSTSYFGSVTSPIMNTSNISTSSCNLNIGCDASTTAVNIACGSNSQIVNIGTSSAGTTINIGGVGDTVNIVGTTNFVQTTELQISDRLITLNKGGIASSGNGAGFEIEENNAISAYVKTSTDRNSFLFKAPNSTSDLIMNLASGGLNFNNGGLVMTSSCNIGIGTSSPVSKLDVSGDITTRGSMWCYTSDANLGVQVFANNQDGVSSNIYQGGLQSWNGIGMKCKYDSNTRHMFDTRTGNFWATGSVGIGTTSPSTKLHVNATGTTTYIRASGDVNQQQGLEFYDTAQRWVMYKPASSVDLRFFDGITDRITFKNGGNVGIGTITPTQTLDVNGTIAVRNGNTTGVTNNQLLLSYVNSDNYKHAIKTRHNANNGVDNAIDFYIWQASQSATDTGNKQVLSITNAGVGIGTSNPAFLLDVKGSLNASNIYVNGAALSPLPTFFTQANLGNYTGSNVGIGTSNFAAKLHITGGGSFVNELLRLEAVSGSNAAYMSYTNGSSYSFIGVDGLGLNDWNRGSLTLVTMCNNPIVFGTNNSQRMILDQNGNLGIGASTPSSKVHVVSGTNNGILIDGSSNNNIALKCTSSGQGWGSGVVLENTTATIGRTFGMYSGSDGKYHISDVTRSLDIFVSDSNGNVGIGTTSPSYKLDVNGDIHVPNNNAFVSGTNTGLIRLSAVGNTSYIQSGLSNATSSAAPLVFGTIGNSTEWGRFDNTGNFGLGTNAPGQKLDVIGNAQFGASTNNKVGMTDFEIKMFGTGIKHYSLYNSNSVFSIRDTSASIPFGTIGTTVFAISNLNVGIGTTTPGCKLDVNGTANALSLSAIASETNTNGSNAALMLRNTSSTNSWYIRAGGSNTSTPNGGLSIGDNSAYRFIIDASGNVGIGVTPAYKLDVNGGMRISFGNQLRLDGTASATATTVLSVGGYGEVSIDAPNVGGGRFVIKDSGNVGVGTASPAYKLDVLGDIRTSNLIFSGNITGNGSNLTNLNMGSAASGILAVARGGTGSTSSTGTAGSANVLATSPSIVSPTLTGTTTAATINATILQQGGTALTTLFATSNHDAGAITTGTIPVVRGGTGVTTSTGTGSTVLSASPTLSGTISVSGSVTATNDMRAVNYIMTSGGDRAWWTFKDFATNTATGVWLVGPDVTGGTQRNWVGIKTNSGWGASERYLNFTGQHRVFTTFDYNDTMRGLIVSSIGKYRNLDHTITPGINETLPIVKLASTEDDISVFGVVSECPDGDSYRFDTGMVMSTYEKTHENDYPVHINALGEGAIWVSNVNGNLSNGDYITTSVIPGYGMKQNSGQLMNYTVAKITCDCDFDDNEYTVLEPQITTIDIEVTGDIYEDKTSTETITEDVYDNKRKCWIRQSKTVSRTERLPKLVTHNVYDIDGNIVGSKVETVQGTYTVTKNTFAKDSEGNILYVNKKDDSGNDIVSTKFDIRYLNINGEIITKQQYTTLQNSGNTVYKAAFVGCTYHSG